MERILETYVTAANPLTARLRLLVVPTIQTIYKMLRENLKPTNMVKRLHALTHAHPDQLIIISKDTKLAKPELGKPIRLI